MNFYRTPAYIRFDQKVDRSGACHIWTGATDPRGYGRFHRGSKTNLLPGDPPGNSGLAHVFAWELDKNMATPKGRIICHTCDNPPCVNPKHLYLGTYKSNNLDTSERKKTYIAAYHQEPGTYGFSNEEQLKKAMRGKDPSWNGNPLTEDDVRSIRERVFNGESQAAIGREMGVTRSTINKITKGHNWKWVDNPSYGTHD